jgi:hypothetical protein
LAGYDLTRASQAISLTLYWRVTTPPPTTWKRFVHAVDAKGQIVSQLDGLPGDGVIPMPAWRSGEYVIDRVRLDLPAGATPQALMVGYYDPETGARLPLTLPSGASPAEREVQLSP